MSHLVLNYISVTRPISTAIVLSAVTLLYIIVRKVLANLSAPIRELAGPKSVKWLTGSLDSNVWEPDSQKYQIEWTLQYGPVFRYYGIFNSTRIIITDLQALNYILNAPEFEKPLFDRQELEAIIGKGLLFFEGLKHRRQRKIMGPAFGLPQIKEFSRLFIEKANEFRDILMTEVAQTDTPDGSLRVNMCVWLNKTTLDIIGEAGFNHQFGSLHQAGPPEMSELLRKVTTFKPFSIKFLIPELIPPARHIFTERFHAIKNMHKSLLSIGQSMIAQKKAEILTTEIGGKGGVEKRNIQGRDLLSLLMKANMATDIPDHARMTEEEILAQIPTFLIAGHETSSFAIAWALYALGCHPEARAKLNAEARAFYTDSPSMDELNGMMYLDYVIRETLRLYAPVPSTVRTPTKDTVVTLSEQYTDRHGVKRHELRLRAGDEIVIPIQVIHRLKSLWGEDADEFKPERWEAIPEAAKAIPGVFGNLLTFITGTHACIGYRFAVTEMKAILFCFVRAFDFELAVPADQIMRKSVTVSRPYLISDTEGGPQLPLVIQPATSD